MTRAASAATKERRAQEVQVRSARQALGLQGTGKEELPEGWEGLSSEAAGGGREEESTSPVRWPPSSGDVQRERSARRGGSVGVARAASAATRERGAREAHARSGRGALGLRGTVKEELPEG